MSQLRVTVRHGDYPIKLWSVATIIEMFYNILMLFTKNSQYLSNWIMWRVIKIQQNKLYLLKIQNIWEIEICEIEKI